MELVPLGALRDRARDVTVPGRLRLGIVEGNVRQMHIEPENAGAVFQVASQFNLLEMTGPTVTPEHGVTGYAHDHTQGPACAIAAGAGTIWRNYLVPVGDRIGQTADRQLDGLTDLGAVLTRDMGVDTGSLWRMRIQLSARLQMPVGVKKHLSSGRIQAIFTSSGTPLGECRAISVEGPVHGGHST